jgi:hypothetical protein
VPDLPGLASDQLYGSAWKSAVHREDIQQLETWWQDLRDTREAGQFRRLLPVVFDPRHVDVGNASAEDFELAMTCYMIVAARFDKAPFFLISWNSSLVRALLA